MPIISQLRENYVFLYCISMKKNLFIAPCIFISGVLSAQSIEVQQVLSQIYTDSAAVALQQIRSAHVYLETRDDRYQPGTTQSIAAKRMEMEFNAQGMRTYQRAVYVSDELQILGNRETTYESFTYDDQQRVSANCMAGSYLSFHCQYFTYNEQGNVVSTTYDDKTTPPVLTTFQWKAGKMIGVKQSDVKRGESLERQFDKQGRVTEISMQKGHKTVFTYADLGPEEGMIAQFYVDNVPTVRYEVHSLKRMKQVTYSCQQNAQLDTLSTMKVAYDSHGHPVSIYSVTYNYDISPVKEEPEPKSETPANERVITPDRKVPAAYIDTFTIENIYSEGLLVKRIIHRTEKNPATALTERIIYERDPLPSMPFPTEKQAY
jgi:hypothetical protein